VETVQRILSIDTVGNAYHLIEGNPLFRLLDEVPGYRRAMSMYRPQRSDGSLKAKEPLP